MVKEGMSIVYKSNKLLYLTRDKIYKVKFAKHRKDMSCLAIFLTKSSFYIVASINGKPFNGEEAFERDFVILDKWEG